MKGIGVHLEVGRRRSFASALDWPGWSRMGRDESGALQALAASASRYKRSTGSAAAGLTLPVSVDDLVIERAEGTSTTDFGAPGVAAAVELAPLGEAEMERLSGLLRACWAAFDVAVERSRGAALASGPRGGGRDLAAIVDHAASADGAYVQRLGGEWRGTVRPGPDIDGVRAAFIEALGRRNRGEVADTGPRGGRRWTARYAIRRSAWHWLDHAWEIEDRSAP